MKCFYKSPEVIKNGDILREITGNPFRPVHLDPSWLTPTVLKLAQEAYLGTTVVCEECNGCRGEEKYPPDDPLNQLMQGSHWYACEACGGQGKVSKGLLDSQQLLVLSDALEEAGSDQKELLEHLRNPRLHFVGCWAIDLILGERTETYP